MVVSLLDGWFTRINNTNESNSPRTFVQAIMDETS